MLGVINKYCGDPNCKNNHIKRFFSKPFLFYAIFAVEDHTSTEYYTYDFNYFYKINSHGDKNKSYICKYIFSKLNFDKYEYFDEKTIHYINCLRYNYDYYFNIFILIPEIIKIPELINIIKNNLQLNTYFAIGCDFNI